MVASQNPPVRESQEIRIEALTHAPPNGGAVKDWTPNMNFTVLMNPFSHF